MLANLRILNSYQVVLLVILFVTCEVKAEGVFDVYNIVEGDRFRVRLTNRDTGKSVESPRIIGFKEAWTVKLAGGQYRIQLSSRRFWRDLGWIDVKKVEKGRIMIGESNKMWTPRKVMRPDGSVQTEWNCAVAAPLNAPPPALVVRFDEEQAFEMPQADLVVNRRVPLGISFDICPKGIHIKAVSVNSPASRCINDSSGLGVALKPEDHVLEVNGVKPRSIEEMQKLVNESPDQIHLKICDSFGKDVRLVSTYLTD